MPQPRRNLPSAPNQPSGAAALDFSKRARRSAPVRVGLNRPTMLSGVRSISEVAQSGKAVTAVAATDLFTSAAHGYSIGDRVRFTALTGGAGIVPSQLYFIIASGFTVNDFRVSATPGGTQLDVTTDLTAGTVTRYISGGFTGTPQIGRDQNSDGMPIPGPRRGGRVR